jgi:hypothetical protein
MQNKTNDMPDVIYADNDVNMPSGGIWSHQSTEGHDTPYIRTPEGANPHDSEVVLTACVNEMTENLRPVTDMEEPWTLRKAAAVAATRITKLGVERGEIMLTLEAQDLSLAAQAATIAELEAKVRERDVQLGKACFDGGYDICAKCGEAVLHDDHGDESAP